MDTKAKTMALVVLHAVFYMYVCYKHDNVLRGLHASYLNLATRLSDFLSAFIPKWPAFSFPTISVYKISGITKLVFPQDKSTGY